VSHGYVVASLDELVGYEEEGRPRWHMIRSTLGVQAFGVNAWTATEDGQQLIGEHDELGQGAGGHEELYIVLTGHATFTLDGEAVTAPAGTVVHVHDPTVKRGAVGSSGTTILVVGAKPGEAFAVSEWERSAEVLRFWTTQEWDRAIEALRRLHAETPDSAGILYNLACAEARAGKDDESLAHLEQAVGLEPRFAELAQTDDDLASIRGDERFPVAGEAVGEQGSG
jgi:tetratricopeptide (TPR) repeat protein